MRSGPLTRRSLVGHRRSHPGPLRRGLRGAKPAYRYAVAWPPLSLAGRATTRRLLPNACSSAWRRSRPPAARRRSIALLTPGTYNETFFEHVFLARYLGFALVEGSDLTVRDNRLYLKTLEGLKRVHVLLRRLDDEYCDPLSLRADSALGVPGLLGAARAGHVAITNALGSGVFETPGACLVFCRRFAKRCLAKRLNFLRSPPRGVAKKASARARDPTSSRVGDQTSVSLHEA